LRMIVVALRVVVGMSDLFVSYQIVIFHILFSQSLPVS
jgi:hypothetical protein